LRGRVRSGGLENKAGAGHPCFTAKVPKRDQVDVHHHTNRDLLLKANLGAEDDLPGSEAPAAWLSYLRGGSAHTLRRVLAHNHRTLCRCRASCGIS